ncbi:MAG: murein biosynthesis integral membrane protein MurJ [Verrucomicrobiota bacterium]
MLKNYRNIAVVSLSTVGSRLLGLVRDIMIFAALGASLWNSAFILAFTLPNLFRRLLGEGALTSAVVPVFSDVVERRGPAAAFEFFNQILLRVAVLLFGTVVASFALLACLNIFGFLPGRWSLGADLSVWLLPYTIFICLAAIISAGLNVLGRFAVPACTPALLNLAMIAALAAGWFLEASQARIVYLLCGGVLVGGVLQLALPAWDLFRQGWRPKLSIEASDDLESVWDLFLPGLMGAAILQINILVSRLLAYGLEESAVSVLYLASRLMELPLGVFTIAIVTVFFPLLAKAVSNKDKADFAASFSRGMRMVLALSLPAGVGLAVLGGPILGLLFQWGAFEAADVDATITLLAIYGFGLPFYSAATFATRGLHARKDMFTPMRVAAVCLITNVLFGITLMQFMGATGLALANVLAAIVQSAMLWNALASSVPSIRLKSLGQSILKILIAALGMGIFCWFGIWLIPEFVPLSGKALDLSLVLLGVPLGAGLYFGLLGLMRFEELGELKSVFKRKSSEL